MTSIKARPNSRENNGFSIQFQFGATAAKHILNGCRSDQILAFRNSEFKSTAWSNTFSELCNRSPVCKIFWFSQMKAPAPSRYLPQTQTSQNQTGKMVAGNFRKDFYYIFKHDGIKSLSICSIKKKDLQQFVRVFFSRFFLIYTLSFQTGESVVEGSYLRVIGGAKSSIFFWNHECSWQQDHSRFSCHSAMNVDNPSSSKTVVTLLADLAGNSCASLEFLVSNFICCVSKSFKKFFSTTNHQVLIFCYWLMPAAFYLSSFMYFNYVWLLETKIAPLATVSDMDEQSYQKCVPISFIKTFKWSLKTPSIQVFKTNNYLKPSTTWSRACKFEVSIVYAW